MKTQPQPYKITISEVVIIIPLLIGIMLAHIAILIWVGYTLSYTGTSQIRALLGRSNPD
jgi:hypothetical protein